MDDILLVVLPILCFVIPMLILIVWTQRRITKMPRAGYEPLLKKGKNTSLSSFYVKDEVLYYNQGINPRKARPIEIISVSEITRNARLVQLEIRFRMDGAIRLVHVGGGWVGPDQLLTLADKLGYGGSL